MRSYAVLVIVAMLCTELRSAKILVLHPLHGGSHKIQLGVLTKELVRKGHTVTTVSFLNVGDVPSFNSPNVTNYVLTVDNSEGLYPYMTVERLGRFRFPVELLWSKGHNPHHLPLDAFKMTEALCRTLFENEELFKILRAEKFNVAIVDVISNECGLALAYQLGIPSTVAYWALFPVSGEMGYIGSFSPPSTVPSFLSRLTEQMSFTQRMYNTYLRIGGILVMEYQLYLTHKYIQEYFPRTPHPKELIANLSAVLINSDYALDYPKLLPPNAVNVGCMQCRDPLPLPMELEEFMNSSGDFGVVVFSMGASFDAAFAHSLLPNLFQAFSRLPQKVLMKIRPSHFANASAPPNVKFTQWFPQQDILAHPKTKVFFTHCGLHGVLEAMWHGVPMIGMPIFGDQFDVLSRLEDKGLAIGIGTDASDEHIYEALSSVLNNTKYSRKSKKVQRLLRDQREHPMERAVWYIEHVLRSDGASHLKLGSRHLSWLQLYCLDIIVTLATILLLLIWLLYKIAYVLTTIFINLVNRLEQQQQERQQTQEFVDQDISKSREQTCSPPPFIRTKIVKND